METRLLTTYISHKLATRKAEADYMAPAYYMAGKGMHVDLVTIRANS